MTGSPEPRAGNTGKAWVFSAADIPRLTLPYRDGVVVYRPETPRPTGVSADTAGNEHEMVDFVPVDRREAARLAVQLARRPDAGSVVVHPRFSPAARTALAIGFAAHLADARRADGLDPNVVTTACAPDLQRLPGHVRVPHLLTISAVPLKTSARGPSGPTKSASGVLAGSAKPISEVRIPQESRAQQKIDRAAFGSQENTDRTVWEIMSVDACRAWLGGRSPDLHDVVEANLPGLLVLRRMLRRPDSCEHLPNGRRIREVLADAKDEDEDDDLTIRRVYRDPDVFLPAACAAADIRLLRLASPPGYSG
jgi:hypothetical protein